MSYRAIVSQEAYRHGAPRNLLMHASTAPPILSPPPFNVSLSHSLLPFNRSIVDKNLEKQKGTRNLSRIWSRLLSAGNRFETISPIYIYRVAREKQKELIPG